MPNYNVNIRVNAQDHASGPLRGIGRSLNGLSGQARKGFSGLQKTVGVGMLGAVGAATAGLAGLGAGLKSVVGLGSDAEEMMGKFNVVFANTGDQVTGSLDKFARQVGRSKFELRGMASEFGDTLKPMGFTEEAAAGLSTDLSKLAVDLGSFNNIETDEALRRLQGTLIGSHENALKFGVVINENVLKQELARMGAEDLTGAQLEQAKVQARINLLMQGTTDAQGDAARTSDSWANTMRRLGSIVKDFGTELGNKVLPIITPLLERFTDMASQALPRLLEQVVAVADGFMAFVDQIAPLMGQRGLAALFFMFDDGTSVLGNLLQVFGVGRERAQGLAAGFLGLVDTVRQFFAPIAEFIGKHVEMQDVLTGLGVVVASIVIPALASIVAAIAPVIAAGAAVVAASALLRKAWENDFLGMRTATQNFWKNTMSPFVEDMRGQIGEQGPKAVSALQDVWENRLQPALQGVVDFARQHLFPMFRALADVWLAATKLQITILAGVFQNVLMPALRTVWRFIRDNVLPMFDGVNESIGGIGSVIDTISEKLSGFAQGLNNVGNNLPGWLTPGSPTPFEMGLRGISGAMDEVRRSQNTFSHSLVINAPLVGGVTMTGEADEHRLADTMMQRLEQMWSASGQAGSRWPVGTTEVA